MVCDLTLKLGTLQFQLLVGVSMSLPLLILKYMISLGSGWNRRQVVRILFRYSFSIFIPDRRIVSSHCGCGGVRIPFLLDEILSDVAFLS